MQSEAGKLDERDKKEHVHSPDVAENEDSATKGNAKRDDGPDPLAKAKLVWSYTIGGGKVEEPSPVTVLPRIKGTITFETHYPTGKVQKESRELEQLPTSKYEPKRHGPLRQFLHKKVADAAIRNMVREERLRDSQKLEEDLLAGGAECLRYLTRCLDGENGQPRLAENALAASGTEDKLAEVLTEMVTTLCKADASWKWELREVRPRLDRIFVVVGACRDTVRKPANILGVLGQQLVLSKEQTKRFLHEGLWARMEVMKELLNKRAVIVADVALEVKQVATREAVQGDDGAGDAEKVQIVEHVLRLEMPLTPEESDEADDDMPVFKSSSWEIVDWNQLCLGNHPALRFGMPAPW